MMATLVGELAPALKHKGTFSVAPTPSERRLCQNGSITSRSRVHVRSSSSNEKVGFRGCGMLGKGLGFVVNATRISLSSTSSNLTARARSYAIGNPMFRHSSEFKDFVEELRFQATRLHIEEQGNSQVFKSASSAEEYLKFLVVSKMVYETMEVIVINSSHPAYDILKKAELVRVKRLTQELHWFASQGYAIPEAGPAGISYANHLMKLSQTNVPAFIGHLHNVYFAHSAGDQFLVQKVFARVAEGLARGNLGNVQRKAKKSLLHSNGAGRKTGRTLLFWAATVCLALWAGGIRPAYAGGDGSGVLAPPSIGNMKSSVVGTLKAMWPKTQQVLEVLRDQGLFLSLLLALSAFFSMAETSITTLWPWKVRELAEKEGEGGVFQVLRQDVTRFLTTILIGTTVVNIAATALVTEAATALFGEAGVTAATGVMTVVLLLVTEIAPKSIAVHNATEVARIVVRPVAWLSVILYPVGRVVTTMSTSLLKLLGLKSSGEPFVSEEELKLMLRGAELSGAIEEEEQDMIENVLEIKDTYVREVMTPLVDVVAIDSAATLLEFRNLWVKHQYSRVPVFERRIDNIVGIAYAMDMLDYVEQVELLQRMNVGRIAHRPAYFVPDSMSVWNLLREFRIRKVHMAIVLNEYGGTVGVVTLEDVVEEIVGEIFDENDSKEEIRKKTGYVVQRADGVFDVDANTSVEDLTEALEIKLPQGSNHYETVSGFVCEAFGYIPRTGESTKITLRKADAEDSDRRDGENQGENQDDRDRREKEKEKFQKYRLEILAGNARKVGSVRFERLEGTTLSREESERSFPRTLHADRPAVEDVRWQDPEENISDDDEGCIPDEDNTDGPKLYLPGSVRCSDELDSFLTSDGLPTVGTYDWEMDTVEKIPKEVETDSEADESTATIVASLSDKWEEEEAQVERRRNRRRKQSAEAAIELDRQQRSNQHK
ncbi:DUF21 domain-containing protein At1g55930, chloroplastic [Physcomitrium patens]|uniref:Uncharacterized protein n=1 Tax=Physcomitrium patens TaxID=3218 RepID=A0A2K1JY55_PHYPA|nr:DUF21 domain-containing protein At1g55930, chloroplastic-like isoform X1 [Physcomitrium patens]PNR46458.1 hypothetical protein PHYPA_013577 [Physcomitrium patens]|eukprot:XP_024386598.1 DUF21 domain-containing protein At1g55930, chloroplastic-like isoform X1 [Physcomitrella patens]